MVQQVKDRPDEVVERVSEKERKLLNLLRSLSFAKVTIIKNDDELQDVKIERTIKL